MDAPKTLQQAIVYFSDADRAFQYAINFRWPNGLVSCPRCGSEKHSFIKTRRIWFCSGCKKQFTVKVGTIFEDSPITLDKWMMVMWMLANCKNGVSSYEIHRSIGVTQKTAWFMLHRIRLAMRDTAPAKLGGSGTPVQMDESYHGGNPQKMHKERRLKLQNERNGQRAQGGVNPGKTAVFGMVESGTRQVRAMAVPNVKRSTLMGVILDNVGFGSTIHTDQYPGYQGMPKQFVHETVNHMREHVTEAGVHTQAIENFWSCLKRTLRGTYVAVEPFHIRKRS
jgi:transposase-like protein